MEITRHSVSRYLERILGYSKKEVESATKEERYEAREEIRKVVEDPEVIYRGEAVENGGGGSAPIYIRGDVAVPVDDHKDREGDIAVPTTYRSSKFREKINAHPRN